MRENDDFDDIQSDEFYYEDDIFADGDLDREFPETDDFLDEYPYDGSGQYNEIEEHF